jgi:hypothetical protein
MTTGTHTRAGRLFGRINDIWIEMDEAQRRMFEIRTGLRTPARPRRSAAGAAGSHRPGDDALRTYEDRAWDEFMC